MSLFSRKPVGLFYKKPLPADTWGRVIQKIGYSWFLCEEEAVGEYEGNLISTRVKIVADLHEMKKWYFFDSETGKGKPIAKGRKR